MNLNCIVVDDDVLSRNVIAHFIQKTNFLNVTGEFDTAMKASGFIRDEHVDIIFLDVQMPEMTGMEFIETLDNGFQVVMITSAEKYAVEAFERSVTDYLVKPVDYARFLQAAHRAKNNIENFRKNLDEREEIYVRSDSKLIRISLGDILFVEALADYVIIKTTIKQHIVHYTMKGIESRLPVRCFARTHRSYIVNLDKIESLEDNSVLINEKYIPIGASYKDALMNRLNFL